MKVAQLFVAGTGLHLAPRMNTAVAEQAGLCDRRTINRTKMRSVCVSEEAGPDLAVAAARKAVTQAFLGPADVVASVDLVLHASTYYQGHDLWAPASYIQRHAVGNACPAIEIGQLSNGGMAAIELAAAYLSANPARTGALITTGDRFCLPGFDRWNTDPGTVCGDGGTAVVLSRTDGFARVVSLVTVSDPELEGMGRGDDPFSSAALTARTPISVEAQRVAVLARMGTTEVLTRLRTGQQVAYDTALAEADVKPTDVAWFVLPNLGRPKMDLQFFEPLDIDPERTTWPWGSGVGHLGAGDQIAGLSHLAGTGELVPGQHCVLVSAGGGFAWSVAVLEILRPPPRAEPD